MLSWMTTTKTATTMSSKKSRVIAKMLVRSGFNPRIPQDVAMARDLCVAFKDASAEAMEIMASHISQVILANEMGDNKQVSELTSMDYIMKSLDKMEAADKENQGKA